MKKVVTVKQFFSGNDSRNRIYLKHSFLSFLNDIHFLFSFWLARFIVWRVLRSNPKAKKQNNPIEAKQTITSGIAQNSQENN